MNSFRTLIVGAGVTGLATAAALSERRDDDYLVLEADREIGGWCKTVKKEGFVWDYSGHFFHFKHPEIEAWLRERMPGQRIRVVEKKSFIALRRHAASTSPSRRTSTSCPRTTSSSACYDLYFARSSDVKRERAAPEGNFKEMLYARFGKGICDRFLVPYNEKLYACDLATLDKDAMGRFFPHADLTDIVSQHEESPNNASYNATFTYPEGGAIEYVKALASARAQGRRRARRGARLGRPRSARWRRPARREIRFERLVSSAPFHRFADVCRPRPRPVDVGLQQGPRLQPGLRPQGQDRTCTGPTTRRSRRASTASAGTTTSSTPTG